MQNSITQCWYSTVFIQYDSYYQTQRLNLKLKSLKALKPKTLITQRQNVKLMNDK